MHSGHPSGSPLYSPYIPQVFYPPYTSYIFSSLSSLSSLQIL